MVVKHVSLKPSGRKTPPSLSFKSPPILILFSPSRILGLLLRKRKVSGGFAWFDFLEGTITAMRLLSFWFVFFLVGAALTFLGLSSTDGVNFAGSGSLANGATGRKLTEHGPNTYGKENTGKANLEDYSPVDPVPSSKTSIRPGPIDHGTPLMPFIPKPSPPSPTQGGG